MIIPHNKDEYHASIIFLVFVLCLLIVTHLGLLNKIMFEKEELERKRIELRINK